MSRAAVHYITGDMGSAHTLKRIRFLKKYFDVNCFGRLNQNNIPKQAKPPWYSNMLLVNYFLRILLSAASIRQIKKIPGNDIIIVRGLEFELLCYLLRKKYVIEVTDIHQWYFNYKLVRKIYNKLYESAVCLLLTSEGYADILRNYDYRIWHNIPDPEMRPLKVLENKCRTLVYCGFLRNYESVNTLSEFVNVALYGKFNQSKNPKSFFAINKKSLNYYGEFCFNDLPKIYSKYIFAYVNDHYGTNSTYNLTNRLYESIYYGSIPVSLDDGSYLSSFMKLHQVGFVANDYEALAKYVNSDLNFTELYETYRGNLNSVIQKDHGKTVMTLRGLSINADINNI